MFFYDLKKHEKDGSFTSMMFLFIGSTLLDLWVLCVLPVN